MNHDQKPGMRCVSRRFQTLAMLFVLASGSFPVAAQDNFWLYFSTAAAPVGVTLNGTGTSCDVTYAAQEPGSFTNSQCGNGTYTSITFTLSNTDYILPEGKTAGTISNRARIGGTMPSSGEPTLSGTYSTSPITLSWDSNRGCATSGLDSHQDSGGVTRTRPLGFLLGTQNEDNGRETWEVARYASGDPNEFLGWDVNIVLMCTLS